MPAQVVLSELQEDPKVKKGRVEEVDHILVIFAVSYLSAKIIFFDLTATQTYKS